ncbi:nitrite/sulfite reductase [Tepidibacter aestuarii]|uniref:nitrite/sulfite reductase n=1 Tax=Tepidibacter aestuarii TaxID=2925782 RepID=UPI0020BDEE03|nr:nitrite/sulfite reductase [Tepidibacter aestuarii]CAH2214607.1 Ferredoxin--nitrite reductase NirA [Tepidibacter aestuarii]
MVRIPKGIINAQYDYIEKAKAYIGGEIPFEEFKHYASPMGVYAQKREGTFMVRPRIFSGIITKEKLEAVVEIAKRFSGGEIHLTTRQDIQFHGLSIEDTIEIFEVLTPLGLIGKGAGGNAIRNINCSPLSGVEVGEVFDVNEHAKKATEFILQMEGMTKLPRKYKIAISNSPKDTAFATISDLGFIAKIQDGRRGFELYGGGGLGGVPDIALKLEAFIPEEEILYHIEAMKRLFEDEGDRTNRNKARIRFIKYRLGNEAFTEKYRVYVEKVKSEKDLYIEFKSDVELDNKLGEGTNKSFEGLRDFRVINQRNKGYYSLYLHPENGDLNVGDLDKILDITDLLDYDVEFRLSNSQGIYIRNVKEKDVESFIKSISAFTKETDIENSTTCTGAKNCRIGLCNSQGLLKEINKVLEGYSIEFKSQLPKIHVSGCRNSCGWHHIGTLGFSGAAIKTESGSIPAYTVHIGGRVGSEISKLGENKGVLPARKVPRFVDRLLERFEKCEIKDFDRFIDVNETLIITLINELKTVDDIPKDIKYFDFENQKPYLSK